jgi:cytochrome c553
MKGAAAPHGYSAICIVVALIAVEHRLPAATDSKPDAKSIEFFEKQIRPLLVARCVSCHGPTQQSSSLRVDSRDALVKGGNRGPAIVPGDASLSLLAKAIRHDGVKMPVGGKLAANEIEAVEKWINLGAPWPNETAAPGAPGLYARLKKEHWAFEPVRDPQPEEVGSDQHSELKKGHEGNALITDQGVAALIKDLKSRGLLKETLVVWATEFGRTPHAPKPDGRDHHETAFSVWMAGGGVKRGFVYGATDEVGMRSVENITEVYDLHATILQLLGLDDKKLTYRFGGRDVSLTDVHGHVIGDILA